MTFTIEAIADTIEEFSKYVNPSQAGEIAAAVYSRLTPLVPAPPVPPPPAPVYVVVGGKAYKAPKAMFDGVRLVRQDTDLLELDPAALPVPTEE